MKKLLKWLFWLILIGALGGGAVFFGLGIQTADEFEAREPLALLVEKEKSSPDYVPYNDVAPMLYKATIAVEDARFYSHGAVDLRSLIRAAASQVLPFIPPSGGSTIDMQTVKNLYKQYDGTAVWKAGEIVLATRLDKICSKDEIISLYVNEINYGHNFQGIEEASWGYYGVPPAQLNDSQATLLAGIPQSPVAFDPILHYDAARRKQLVVLNAMVRNKMITQSEADEIYAQDCYPTGSALVLPYANNHKNLMIYDQIMRFFLFGQNPDSFRNMEML